MAASPAPSSRPWGLSRMAPYPPTEPLPYTHAELDPATQTARYYDAEGHILQAGKHGPSNVVQPTNTQTEVAQDGPQGPTKTVTDTTTDYVPD